VGLAYLNAVARQAGHDSGGMSPSYLPVEKPIQVPPWPAQRPADLPRRRRARRGQSTRVGTSSSRPHFKTGIPQAW